MSRLAVFFRVPVFVRVLCAVGALATAIALPALLSSGNYFQVMFPALAGWFALCIAVFGRSHQDRSQRT